MSVFIMSEWGAPTSVMDKVRQRIGELEQAIQRLDFVKRHLTQNSTEIKSQIHSSISRHLETLRNRELRLLEEVDTVVGGKEEVLHRQQARLNKALGVLHSSLAHATAAGSEDETAAKHLVHALEQLNTTDLKAEETPYVAFRADHVSLRESILSYGRVDAKGMPLMTAFADDDKPSASLPRHLEEYEDSEHHVFYKTLQGPSQVCVTMPKLSSRVEDWLQRPMLEFCASADPSHTPHQAESVGTPVSQTTCAIQNWLSQIKHNPDVEEEDDFEIVDHSGSSQRGSPLEEERPVVVYMEEQESFVSMFQHVPRDLHLWLLQGSVSKTTGPSADELRAFFKHIPQDTSMWLMAARKQLQSLDELKQCNWFRNVPTDTATWLRRVHDKRAPGTAPSPAPDMFAHISRDKAVWLKKESSLSFITETVKMSGQQRTEKKSVKRNSMPADLEHYVMKRPVAPAPCATSPIPNPMQVYASLLPSDIEYWLLRKDGLGGGAGAASAAGLHVGEEAASALPGVLRVGNSSTNNMSAWLLKPVAEEECPSSSSVHNFFSHISTTTSDWLARPDHSATSVRQEVSLKVSGDQELWLSAASASAFKEGGLPTSALPVSPLDSLRAAHSHLSMADWLLGGGLGQREGRDSPQLSEISWTACSTESSLSTASTASSLQSLPMPAPLPPKQVASTDLATWIYQKCL